MPAGLTAPMPEAVTTINLSGFGEALPRFENYVDLDPNVVDVFGIPVLRIHMSWSGNERAMIPDMAESAAELLDTAGARNIRPWMVPDRIPGMGIRGRRRTDRPTGVADRSTRPRLHRLRRAGRPPRP